MIIILYSDKEIKVLLVDKLNLLFQLKPIMYTDINSKPSYIPG